MDRNECPVCQKTLYSRLDFKREPVSKEGADMKEEMRPHEDFSKYALPNWPVGVPGRAIPHKDNETRSWVQELDPMRRSVYDRLVVQCDREGCTTSYMIKQRDEHYIKCQSFVKYRCIAPIC